MKKKKNFQKKALYTGVWNNWWNIIFSNIIIELFPVRLSDWWPSTRFSFVKTPIRKNTWFSKWSSQRFMLAEFSRFWRWCITHSKSALSHKPWNMLGGFFLEYTIYVNINRNLRLRRTGVNLVRYSVERVGRCNN